MKYISVQVNLKSHNLFSTGAVPNKGFFFKQKGCDKKNEIYHKCLGSTEWKNTSIAKKYIEHF